MNTLPVNTEVSLTNIRFLEPIGQGGFGCVYLAEIERGNGFRQRVAVKQIHSEYANDVQLMGRQRDEARLMGTLRHDRIVQVYDFCAYQGQMMILMEHIQGPSVSEIVKSTVASADLVAQMIYDCSQALAYAWSAPHPDTGLPLQVIHRDIKPSNIVLSHTGHFKLLDFGIARAEMTRDVATGSFQVGTERYMAPEQWLHNRVSSAVDVYALGLTALEMLLGQLLPRMPLDSVCFHQEMCKRFATLQVEGTPILVDTLKSLLWDMLQFHDDQRPSMEQLLSRSEGVFEAFSGHPAREFLKTYEAPLRETKHASENSVPSLLPFEQSLDIVEAQSSVLRQRMKKLIGWGILLTMAIGWLSVQSQDEPTTSTEVVLISDDVSPIKHPDFIEDDAISVEMNITTPTVPEPVDVQEVSQDRSSKKETRKPEISHSVVISSIPMGATVWVDGVELGRTLLNGVSLTEGQHQIRLQFGEREIRKQIDVRSAQRFVWQMDAEGVDQWSTF